MAGPGHLEGGWAFESLFLGINRLTDGGADALKESIGLLARNSAAAVVVPGNCFGHIRKVSETKEDFWGGLKCRTHAGPNISAGH